MPELPEVEMCRRDLAKWVAGRVVERVILVEPGVVRPRLSTRASDALHDGERILCDILVGHQGEEPVRAGKRIGWVFGDGAVIVHLGMTGRWRLSDDGLEPPRWGRLGLALCGGGTLWFIDPRRFGCVVPVLASGLQSILQAGLGPDALTEVSSGALLGERLCGKRAVKVALLDQAVLAGLGNIHAAEALFHAGIDPWTRCDRLSSAQLDALARSIPKQLRSALAQVEPGEELVYVPDGGPNIFVVYGREGEHCRRCSTTIDRRAQSGRSTFWCSGCQH